MAALVREETRGLLGDDDVLRIVREAIDELAGAGPLEALLREPGRHRRPGERSRPGVDRPGCRPGAGPTCGSPTTTPSAGSRCAWPVRPGAGWTTPRPGWTSGCRTAPACTPSCRRCRAAGTCLSLRVLRRSAHSLDDLDALGTLPGESGGPAAGARRGDGRPSSSPAAPGRARPPCCPRCWARSIPAERIVVCEDAAELSPAHPHVVRLLTRPPNVEGVGQVTLRDLVRQALRMRPDRLVVGEVRGPEVTDLLAALNTGHDGGCGTLHANRPAEVPARLEALGRGRRPGADGGPQPGRRGTALVVHLRRTPAGRRVDEIGVVRRSGDLVVVERGLARRRRPVSRPPAAGRVAGGGAARVVMVALCCAAGLALWPDRDALRRRRVTAVLGRRASPWRGAGRAVPPCRPAVAAVAALGGAVVSTPLVAALGGAAAFVGARAWLSARAGRGTEGRLLALADGLGALAAELRSGRSLEAATRTAAAACADDECGRALAPRSGHPRPRPATGPGASPTRWRGSRRRVRLSGRTGCSLAAVAGAVEDDLRARHRLRLELRTATAAPQASAALLAGLPVMGLAMGTASGRTPGAS